MRSIGFFILAALAEIAGCYGFWLWLKEERHWLWATLAMPVLGLFAMALTRADFPFAGRTYAAYGGVYVAVAMLWLWAVEQSRPDRWDLIGVAICLCGTAVILFSPRSIPL